MEKYIRNCPKCGKEITYTSKYTMKKATEKQSVCKQCRNIKQKNRKSNYEIWIDKYGKEIADQKMEKYKKQCSIKYSKENNPMYHKLVYEIWVEKYGKEIADKKLIEQSNKKKNKWKNKSQIELLRHKEKISNATFGENNAMYGKSFYNIWIDKYGKEVADQKLKNLKHKCSLKTKGENNPMYGKPPSYKSGNGWSGHYKNIQFRSMLELYYLIYLIDNNIPFENGELKKHRIEYEIDKIKRNYFPDFYLINTNQIIEIKPKKLVNTYQNKLKFTAAKQKLGNKHIILTEDNIQNIDIERLYDLYQKNELVFDKKYEDKFLNLYKKGVNKNGKNKI